MLVSGIAAWAFVNKPKEERTIKVRGRNVKVPARYTMDLIITDDDAKTLSAEGIDVKQLDDDVKGIANSKGKHYITIKKNAYYEDGTEAAAPEVVDASCKPFKKLIGNGSEVNVVFAAKPYDSPMGSGVSCRLAKVQVIKLVEYGEPLEDFTPLTSGNKTEDEDFSNVLS